MTFTTLETSSGRSARHFWKIPVILSANFPIFWRISQFCAQTKLEIFQKYKAKIQFFFIYDYTILYNNTMYLCIFFFFFFRKTSIMRTDVEIIMKFGTHVLNYIIYHLGSHPFRGYRNAQKNKFNPNLCLAYWNFSRNF